MRKNRKLTIINKQITLNNPIFIIHPDKDSNLNFSNIKTSSGNVSVEMSNSKDRVQTGSKTTAKEFILDFIKTVREQINKHPRAVITATSASNLITTDYLLKVITQHEPVLEVSNLIYNLLNY